MSKDLTTVICPITFMGKEPQANDSINALFTNAYDTKMITDLSHSAMCDTIKAQTENFEDPTFMGWAMETMEADHHASVDAIMAYLVSNITELCYQTLIRFLSSTFTLEAMGEDSENIDFHMPSQAEIIGGYMRDIDIAKEVTLAITASNIPFINSGREYNPQQIYVLTDISMNTIYSMLLVKVFNAFVNDHVNIAVQKGALDRLYELLYVECYGEPEDHNINIPKVDVEYAFCSSILREKMENLLGDFRGALMMVARTASCMIINSAEFTDHLFDKNYSTQDLLEENAYMSSHVSIKGITDND